MKHNVFILLKITCNIVFIRFCVVCSLLYKLVLTVRRLQQIQEVHCSNTTKYTKIYIKHFNLLK